MRIAFVNITPQVGTWKSKLGGDIFYIYTYLKNKNRNNISVEFFNFNSLFLNASNIYLSLLLNFKPDMIFFFSYYWNVNIIKTLTYNIKCVQPNIEVVVGGVDTAYNIEQFLNSCLPCDIIIRGECEETLNEIVNASIKNNRDYKNILGITYRQGKLIIKNEDRPLLEDINTLPSPFLDNPTIELSLYDGEVAYETLRGCNFSCSYCLLYSKGLQKVRKYDIIRVEKELKVLLLSKDVKIIWFTDPTFNFDEDRAIQILKIIKKYNPQKPLAFEIKAELLTDNLLDYMKKLNIVSLGIGLQSSSQHVNKCVQRSYNPYLFEKNIKKLKSLIPSCELDIDLIYGLPGDTFCRYKKSIHYILELGCQVFYQPLRIFNGSKLFNEVSQYGIQYNKFDHNIICNNTYSLKQMYRTHCINVGIDFINKKGIYREIIDLIKLKEKCRYSDILERIGHYFGQKKRYDIFRMGSWMPDDRNEEQIFYDFYDVISSYIKEDKSTINNKIKKTLIGYEKTMSYNKYPKKFKHSYFHLSF